MLGGNKKNMNDEVRDLYYKAKPEYGKQTNILAVVQETIAHDAWYILTTCS